MTDDADADSLMRALAAAPPVKPPARRVTVMAIQLGDAAPHADQIDSIRQLIGGEAEMVRRDGSAMILVWAEAVLAAGRALELRDALPETRIALTTGTDDVKAVSARASALLARGTERVTIDKATAELVEPKFELETSDADSLVVLVEPLASGTPALVNRVIGNYRITRLLGTGGMGVVYLAEHVTLGRKAVVKYVQDRLAKDAEYTARFFTEAKTTALIRHPGIVDVFDYGKDEHGRPYIVMEFLEGESLRTRMRREKPLPVELALALGAQIASALAAAHAADVIHRDLKPDNLFLVPDNESAHKVRAKVLDFGLAKVTTDDAPGVTQSGNFVGTPLYMSPEQCRSKASIDHRTDIYSLGCILFEMVTGRVPFTDKTVGDLIIAHNTITPPTPSDLVEGLPPAVDRAILKALAKHPDDRYEATSAFHSVLSQLAATHKPELLAVARTAPARPKGTTAPPQLKTPPARPRGISAPPPITEGANRASAVAMSTIEPDAAVAEPARRRLSRRTLALGALVAAVVGGAIVIGVVAMSSNSPTRAARTQATGRRAVAVLDFDNQSRKQDAAWLSTAIGEVIATDLRSGNQLHVMPGADVARMKSELGVGDAAEWTVDRLKLVRSDVGADYLVAGAYLAVGEAGQLKISARLYDTSSGALLARAEETGAESELIALGWRIASTFKRELGIEVPDVAPPVLSVLPAKASTAKLYAEGLAELRKLDLIAARDKLSKAIADDPNEPLVHHALVSVWRELGYDGKARNEAKLAYDFSKALPREYQLAIEAQYRETTGQWAQAVQAYKDLFEFFPGRLDYGLSLASVQSRSGDVKSAYATLAALRKLPHPIGSDPRIDLAEATAAEESDDMERMRVSAERAVIFARKRGAKVLLAKSLHKHGWALFTLARVGEAEPLLAEARQLFADLGDRSGVARVLNNIALIHHRNHKDREAEVAFAEALEHAVAIGDTTAQAWTLNNWGYVKADRGDLPKALELAKKKLELGGERGDTAASQALAHANIVEILRWRGELTVALEHCDAAENLLRGTDARRFASYTAQQCGEVLRVRDDLDGAKRRLDQAASWASDVMTPAETAEIRIAMARIHLDAGRPAEAEPLVRAAASDLEAAGEGSQRVCATAVLAGALLARGKTADANEVIAATASLPSEGVSFACRVEADIVRAKTLATADPSKAVDARKILEDARTRSAAATFAQLEQQARLALGELTAGAAGTQLLRQLAKDAEALGFAAMARRAKAAAR